MEDIGITVFDFIVIVMTGISEEILQKIETLNSVNQERTVYIIDRFLMVISVP